MTTERKRRIIAPPDAEDIRLDDDSYQYFGLDVTERLKTLKEKITDREKLIFDLDTALTMLGSVEDSEEGHQEDTNLPCQCAKCETVRLTKIRRQMVLGVRQLRRMYQDLS